MSYPRSLIAIATAATAFLTYGDLNAVEVVAVYRADGDDVAAKRWREDGKDSSSKPRVFELIKQAGAWPYWEDPRKKYDADWVLELDSLLDATGARRFTVSSVSDGEGISVALNGLHRPRVIVGKLSERDARWSLNWDAGLLEKFGVPISTEQIKRLNEIHSINDVPLLLDLWRDVETNPHDREASEKFLDATFRSLKIADKDIHEACSEVYSSEQNAALKKHHSTHRTGESIEYYNKGDVTPDGTVARGDFGFVHVYGCCLDDEQAMAVLADDVHMGMVLGPFVDQWLRAGCRLDDAGVNSAILKHFYPVSQCDMRDLGARGEAREKCLAELFTEEQLSRRISVSFVLSDLGDGFKKIVDAAGGTMKLDGEKVVVEFPSPEERE